MPAPRIESIEFFGEPGSLDPASGECRLRVGLEGGRFSTFLAATFDRADSWLKEEKAGFRWSSPVLFVERLDKDTVKAAVERMAADKGGWWLRYYNSLGELRKGKAVK